MKKYGSEYFWVWSPDLPAVVLRGRKIEEAVKIYAQDHKIVMRSVYAIPYDEARHFRPNLGIKEVDPIERV